MPTNDTQTNQLKGWYKQAIKDTWPSLLDLYNDTFSNKAKRPQGRDGQSNKRPKWIFRGQGKDLDLTTSLDRAFARYGIPARECDRRDVEKELLRSFMRKAHHYMPNEPDSDDLIEWLATMRHYGAPTRMLDWTYSFYVAVYNAVESWNPEQQKADQETPQEKVGKKIPKKRQIAKWPVLWALDAAWLKSDRRLSSQEKLAPRGIDKTRHEQNNVLKYLMNTRSPRSLVYNATGFCLNERLIAQQGTFLVQGSLAKSFWENLRESFGEDPRSHIHHIELKIDEKERDTILRELNNMNINHATLYPDLEGFAKSLERHMAYPENWGLHIKKEYR